MFDHTQALINRRARAAGAAMDRAVDYETRDNRADAAFYADLAAKLGAMDLLAFTAPTVGMVSARRADHPHSNDIYTLQGGPSLAEHRARTMLRLRHGFTDAEVEDAFREARAAYGSTVTA